MFITFVAINSSELAAHVVALERVKEYSEIDVEVIPTKLLYKHISLTPTVLMRSNW